MWLMMNRHFLQLLLRQFAQSSERQQHLFLKCCRKNPISITVSYLRFVSFLFFASVSTIYMRQKKIKNTACSDAQGGEVNVQHLNDRTRVSRGASICFL